MALGKAQSAGTLHSGLASAVGSNGVKVAPGKCSAYSEIRPRRSFFSSMTHASFSLSIPAGSCTNPVESESVTALAPMSRSFSIVYWATLPLPETRQVFASRLSSRVRSISCAK